MQDEAKTEQPPLVGGHHRVQRRLDLHGVGLLGETESDRQSSHVGVDREPGLVEGHRADHIGGLAPDAGKSDQVLQPVRDVTAVLVEQAARHALEALGLLTEEARGVDDLLEFGGVGLGEGDRIGPSPEDLGGGQVHPFVGALRRQDRGHQQLERIAVVELTQIDRRARIVLGQELVRHLGPAGGRARTSSTVGRIGVRESGAGHGGDRTRR